MPYLTTRKNLKLQLSAGLVASYDIQPGNGVGLFWDAKHTHIFTYLLTFPGHTWGPVDLMNAQHCHTTGCYNLHPLSSFTIITLPKTILLSKRQ